MDIDPRADDIRPFYYFVIAFTVLHFVVSTTLFTRQRAKFPVNGHNAPLVIIFALAITSLPLIDAFAELTHADTCSVSTVALLTVSAVVINFFAAQALRLWFEYNFAEERMQSVRSVSGVQSHPGWFTRHRKFFKPATLVAATVGVSLVELAVGVAIIISLEDSAFDAEVECKQIVIMIGVLTSLVAVVMIFIVVTYWQFRHKRDGYGIKRMFARWAIIAQVLSPPYVLILVWEAFDDLPYYVASVRVLADFLCINLLMFVALDWPVYLSFNEAAQDGLSSILHGDDDSGDDAQVRAVLRMSDEASASAGAGAVAGKRSGSRSASDRNVQLQPDNNKRYAPPSGSHAVFSTKTLALTLKDIVRKKQHAAQLESFARHLVGEFNVAGLLFFLRVASFQRCAVAASFQKCAAAATKADELSAVKSSSSSSSDLVVDAAAAKRAEEPNLAIADADTVELSDLSIEDAQSSNDVACKALGVYFEFLADDAPSKIYIGDHMPKLIAAELEESIVDFRQLPANVAAADIRLKRALSTSMFDRAQSTVLSLIEKDAFKRWRNAVREQVEANAAAAAVESTSHAV